MWMRMVDLLPPAGEVVETQDREGNVRKLVRRGQRWYTIGGIEVDAPTHWRYSSGEE